MPSGVYVRTKKARENMSKAFKGRKSWNKNLTKETDGRVAKNARNTSKGRKEFFAKMTKEEKIEFLEHWIEAGHKSQKKRWVTITKDERRKFCRPFFEAGLKAIQKQWDQMNKEERRERSRLFVEAGITASKARKGSTKETNEIVAKQSKTLKKRLLEDPELLKRMLTRRFPTSLEEKFQKIINKYNLPYKYVGDGSFIIGGKNPDFVNTNNEKIAIEVYARYYKKRNHENIERWKEERQKIFDKYGWKIIFFNEVEVNEKNVLEQIN